MDIPLTKGRHFICLILVVASIRLLYFNLVFPFFNNVDEVLHFDTIVKHSTYKFPKKGDEHFSRESAELIVWNVSPEYFNKKKDKYYLPLAMLPPDSANNMAQRGVAHWMTLENHEAFSPPVYYVFAGAFYNLGKTLGIEGRNLLYWTRLLNVPIYLLTLLVSYILLTKIFGKHAIVSACLILLAVFPQDTYYSFNSHQLNPLFFVIFLYCTYILYYKSDYRWRHYRPQLVRFQGNHTNTQP